MFMPIMVEVIHQPPSDKYPQHSEERQFKEYIETLNDYMKIPG